MSGWRRKKGIKKLVSIKSGKLWCWSFINGDGPIPFTKALDLAGWSIKDVDLFEVNEAGSTKFSGFKALSIPEKTTNGGAIALGHPIGASGTRILVTLIHEMIKRDVKKGLATLCIGGGMGIANVLKDKTLSFNGITYNKSSRLCSQN